MAQEMAKKAIKDKIRQEYLGALGLEGLSFNIKMIFFLKIDENIRTKRLKNKLKTFIFAVNFKMTVQDPGIKFVHTTFLLLKSRILDCEIKIFNFESQESQLSQHVHSRTA